MESATNDPAFRLPLELVRDEPTGSPMPASWEVDADAVTGSLHP